MSIYNKPTADILDRLAKANALILVISTYGRRFFYSKARDRVAEMVITPRGEIAIIDDYTGMVVRVAGDRWHGWSHGGTLRDLVTLLAQYVLADLPLSMEWIGPERYSERSNIWGYEASEMAKCRAAALATGVVLAAEVSA